MKTTTLSLLVSLAPVLCLAQNVTETVKPQTVTKATYLVIYRPGPAWLTGKSVMEQPLKEHGKYMLSLYIKGSMKLAGPLTDNAGGAVLLDVSNEAEARTIVANDPAVQSGIFVYEMQPCIFPASRTSGLKASRSKKLREPRFHPTKISG